MRVKQRRLAGLALAACLLPLLASQPSQAMNVVTTRPTGCQLNVPVVLQTLAIQFDAPPALPPSGAIRIAGTMSGLHRVTSRTFDDWLLVDVTTGPFLPGETVTVNLRQDVQSKAGSRLAGGHCFTFTIRAAPAAAAWAEPLVFDTADIPYFIHGGDLNGDRIPDLAVPNEGTSDVSIFLNHAGDGRFPTHTEYGVGTRPSSIFGEDLDNDGDQDLATADILGGTVSVLRNLGNGTFAPAVSYPAGFQTRQVHGADFNGDNFVDLCATSNSTDEVYVFINDGRGLFTGLFPFDVTGGPFAIRAVDVDGDGHIDIAVALNGTGRLIVLHNDGAASFTQRGPYTVGAGPWDLNGADFDADGDIDLVAVLATSSRMAMLENDGTGVFAVSQTMVTGSFPLGVFAADLDGDGDVDTATSSFNGGTTRVFDNDGAGAFAPNGTLNVQQSASYTWAHDLDGDGDLDLSVVDELSDKLFVFLNRSPDTNAVDAPPLAAARATRFSVWPNPLRAGAVATLMLEAVRPPAVSSTSGGIAVDVVRVDGRLVQRIELHPVSPTRFEQSWDGRDAAGQRVASGQYYLTTRVGGERITQAIRLVR